MSIFRTKYNECYHVVDYSRQSATHDHLSSLHTLKELFVIENIHIIGHPIPSYYTDKLMCILEPFCVVLFCPLPRLVPVGILVDTRFKYSTEKRNVLHVGKPLVYPFCVSPNLSFGPQTKHDLCPGVRRRNRTPVPIPD